MAEAKELKYHLSDEVDENGRQFVLTSDGKVEFGEIGADTGLTPAPILLSEGIITNPETNDGYGLVHIEARHGDQIRGAGYNSVVEFIEEVAKNYEVIREGKNRDGNRTYMLQLTDKHNNTLMVELSGDGTYWNINTAGIFKTSYGAKRNVVYNRHTTAKQSAETAEASLSGEQSGTTPSTSMNAPTQTLGGVSVVKDSNNSVTDQAKAEKVAENQSPTAIQQAEQETNTEPTEAQKAAGNYKKGHLKIDGYDISIENPKGSMRRGTDADGNEWEQEMHNTYGYIRGTEGVDGDHIDVFLSDDPTSGDVFVVDQVNKDGSFDEHKVMYGFPDIESARKAYLSNYKDGWQGLGAITPVSKEEFKKWIESSHRKTKPFAEYSSVQTLGDTLLGEQSKQEEQPEKKAYGTGNKLVSTERYEELKKRMKQKMRGQLNMGIDPEILAIGTEMAAYHIEAGARKFADYAKHMTEDLGDGIRPYLKAFYNGARDLPEMEAAGLSAQMDGYDAVRKFDVANFDKSSVNAMATAETVSREQEVEKEKKENSSESTKSKKKSVSSQSEPSLFGDLLSSGTERQNNSDDGLQRTDELRTEGVPAEPAGGRERRVRTDGKEPQEESGGTDAGRESTGLGRVRQGVQPALRLDEQLGQSGRNIRNNHAERGKDYAPKDVDARIEANIAAIELMQKLMEEERQATPEEMQVLRRFSGWGGLGKAFQDSSNGWSAYGAPGRLKKLLGEDGYQQANMSRNSAYFTPAKVIDTLWDIARGLGFKGGKVLEGSAGIGNILGLMPPDMSERSDIHAVEIDGTSGNILSLLYPDAKVDVQGFEQTRIPNGSIDLAITNVPFVTGLRVDDTTGDKDLSRRFKDIHDFCIAKNIRKLRDGGIGIFITSSGTLDNSQKMRDWITSEGNSDVVGAFRMHNATFGGTSATSDIIVVRKRVNGKPSANAIDVSTVTGERTANYDTGETKKSKGVETAIIKSLSMDYNRYFIEHPEMMGGEMHFGFERGDTYRPKSKGLFPKRGINQDQRLADFVKSLEGKEWESVSAAPANEITDTAYEEFGDGVKEGSMLIDGNGSLCVAAYGRAVPLDINKNKVKGHTKQECFKAYSAIKDAVSDVLAYQSENEDNDGLQPLLDKLNNVFDYFVDTYGHFYNKQGVYSNPGISFLKNDMDYPGIAALESVKEYNDEQGRRQARFIKGDIFSQRVIEKEIEPRPKNVQDGIQSSLYLFGRIDMPWLAEQLGKSESEVKGAIIESGLGFENPVSRQMEVSYEYLSGNVREKLRQAEEAEAADGNGEYDANIKALEKVVPMDIPAHLIEFTLGSSWIDAKLYEDYIHERTGIRLKLTNVGGTWITVMPKWGLDNEKNREWSIDSKMCDKTIWGHELMMSALQNRSVTVQKTETDRMTKEKRTITDREATSACSARIDEIRQDFKDWARGKVSADAELSRKLEQVYNERFNNFVAKSVPDNFVPKYFGGANHKFEMRPHQAKAAIRATTQNLMFAHEVGTGKTFTLITTAMEMRRLGTARKPMIVVQNATVGQFVASAKELYPNAKILTLEDGDRNAEGRKAFYAKIRYNDWDMIVIPQSTLDMIPDSPERNMAYVKDKIEEKVMVLEQLQAADISGFELKRAQDELSKLEEELADYTQQASEKKKQRDGKKEAVTRQNAEVKAKEMLDRKVDDVEDFDEMGIDAILVDEAHAYKHLGFATAMQRGVKGIDPSYSKKSQGLYLKCQSVMEKTGGKNVIFATGTPISNTAAEIWTFMRYLMPKHVMEEYGIYYFDDFVRNFGNLQQMLEFQASGKFKENNRFAGYVNLPELVRIWSGIADTMLSTTIDEMRAKEDKPPLRPEMEDGEAQDIYLPQTKALRSVMKYVRKQLEDYGQMTGKEKKAHSHIPLVMYGIAKAAAVDTRLVVSDAADEPDSKTNEAVRQTLRSLEETKSYNGTVALFADMYQNKHSGFNLYEDIRGKLIERGVPAEQIVIMTSKMSIKKKVEIFDKMNAGEVRVMLGSTYTLGTGVNIQERLHTLIHLDAPVRPMDYTQRMGRILRQGNLHQEWGIPVRVLRFGVEDSLDVTAYQRLKTKGAIADSIMHGQQFMSNSMENRSMEEEEDVFGDTVAQLSGSEYAMLKQQAEREVRKLEARFKQYKSDQMYIHQRKPQLENIIAAEHRSITQWQQNLEKLQSVDAKPQIVVGKQRFDSFDKMGDFFKEHNKGVREAEEKMKQKYGDAKETRQLVMNIGGFDFTFTTKISKETRSSERALFSAVIRKITYSCPELGLTNIPIKGGYIRGGVEFVVNEILSGNDFRSSIDHMTGLVETHEKELEILKAREGKPFEHTQALEDAKARYDEYEQKMKEELEAKEAKYTEMDADIDEATDVSAAAEVEDEDTEEEDGSLFRDGGDDVADEQVAADEQGRGRYVAAREREREAYARRQWRRAHERAADVVKKLGIEERVELMDFADGLTGRRAKAKGWYDVGTDRIVVVLGNHRSPEDVVRTILHEAVAHYGLRKLLGRNFDVFLDNVFGYADEGVRRRIVELAKAHGWDLRVATEEYLAGLAEDTDFERAMDSGWWLRIKDLFLRMLHSIGLEGYGGEVLTDNELRYMLWRSYENLTEPGRYRNLFSLAKDVAMQDRLGVGDYVNSSFSLEGKPNGHVAELFRDGEVAEYVNGIRKRYGLNGGSMLHVVSGQEDIDRLQGAVNAEAIFSIQEAFNERGTTGVYLPSNDLVVIFAGKVDGVQDAEETWWHEQAHGFWHRLPEDVRKEYGAACLDYVQRKNPEVYNKIIGGYEKEAWKNEACAYLIEMTINVHGAEAFLNARFEGNGKIAAFADEFRTYIKNYGKGKEKRREAGNRLRQTNEGLQSEASKSYNLRGWDYESEGVSEEGVNRRIGSDDVRPRVIARAAYESMVSSGMYQFREAVQDSMLGLRKLYEAVLDGERKDGAQGKVGIEDVAGFENAYIAENGMSSANLSQQHEWHREFMVPLLEAVSGLVGNDVEARAELTDYMMAKHGLERNRVLAERDARESALAVVPEKPRRPTGADAADAVKMDAYRQELEAWQDEFEEKRDAYYAENRERDYSGLTALTGEDDVAAAEAAAREMVDSYEGVHDTAAQAPLTNTHL